MDIRKDSVLAHLNMENEDEDYDAFLKRLEAEITAHQVDTEPLKLPKRGNPIANQYPQEYMADLSKKAVAVRQSNAAKRKANKRKIVEAAFNQVDAPLDRPLTESDIELLIESITLRRRTLIATSEEYICKRVTDLLKSVLPRDVRLCWEKYPQVMMPSPGFSYTASEEYGQGISFWIKPNLPAFFEQGTEVDMLRKEKRIYLYKIDKAILQYKTNQDKLVKDVARYKWMLRMMYSKTFAGLLQLNPFWFEMLYKALFNKDLCNYD